jgi:hypothetical protein
LFEGAVVEPTPIFPVVEILSPVVRGKRLAPTLLQKLMVEVLIHEVPAPVDDRSWPDEPTLFEAS